MHICFITNEFPKAGYPHGGVGTFIETISKYLVKKNHSITILGINNYDFKDEDFVDDGVRVIRLKPKIVKGLTWYFNTGRINKTLKKINKENPIDIVESAELGLAFIRKLPSVKYVIRLHGGHHFFAESEERGINAWKGFQEKRSFKKADGFIAVSNYVKSHTNKYLSYHNKPIEIIRYPINLDVFQPRNDVKVDANLILFAGTVCEKKGIRQLVSTMEQVLKAFPNARLEVYGRDWYFKNGDSYIDYLKTKVMDSFDAAIKNAIVFKGVVSLQDLSKKYAEAAVCVFPSLMETQGLVAPEAMATERPVVFSSVGPGKETISHKDTGLLCNPYDSEDIAKQIIWCFNNNKSANAMAKRGREFVLQTFDIETVSTQNINFYKTL